MTPAEATLIISRLDGLATDVAEIKVQTTRTNGRVTAIELARAYEAGAAKQLAAATAVASRRTVEYVGWIIAVAAILVGAYT